MKIYYCDFCFGDNRINFGFYEKDENSVIYIKHHKQFVNTTDYDHETNSIVGRSDISYDHALELVIDGIECRIQEQYMIAAKLSLIENPSKGSFYLAPES